MELLQRRRVVVVLACLAAVGLLAGYAMAVRGRPRSTPIALDSPAPRASGSGRTIYVHVGGAVHKPGLYELADGDRVNDAVHLAGGPTDDADLDAMNLAAKVKDGDKILVPKRGVPGTMGVPGGAAAPGAPAQGGGGAMSLVNLNTATADQLETLPGIGPAIAQRILSYRTEHGGFRRVDDLLEVPGIGPKKFEELKSHVTV